jgi:hypothetical protein
MTISVPPSLTEQAISAYLDGHPQAHLIPSMTKMMKDLTDHWTAAGLALDIQAIAVSSHASAMLSAQKIIGVGKPGFIDLLVDDVVDTVKGRTHPGVLEWLTPQ